VYSWSVQVRVNFANKIDISNDDTYLLNVEKCYAMITTPGDNCEVLRSRNLGAKTRKKQKSRTDTTREYSTKVRRDRVFEIFITFYVHKFVLTTSFYKSDVTVYSTFPYDNIIFSTIAFQVHARRLRTFQSFFCDRFDQLDRGRCPSNDLAFKRSTLSSLHNEWTEFAEFQISTITFTQTVLI